MGTDPAGGSRISGGRSTCGTGGRLSGSRKASKVAAVQGAKGAEVREALAADNSPNWTRAAARSPRRRSSAAGCGAAAGGRLEVEERPGGCATAAAAAAAASRRAR